MAQASAGETPFGFAFTSSGLLVVSEAFGGMTDLSAVSSYGVDGSGMISAISSSVPTTETAACWIAISRDDRFAYTTNTGSGSITGYAINNSTGELTRLDADGVTGDTGMDSGPLDMAFARNGRFLYVLNAGTHEIAAFVQNSHTGGLYWLQAVGDLPESANGLAAW